MVTDNERERAWGAVHDAIAQMPGSAVGPFTYYGDMTSGASPRSTSLG